MRLLRFAVILLIAIALGTAYMWHQRTSSASAALSDLLGVEVTIDDISLGFNRLSVSGLKIGSRPESQLDHAFKAKEIHVEGLGFWELFQSRIEVDDVNIKNPNIGVELYNSAGSDNNWSRITEGIDEKAYDDITRIQINHLLMEDIEITAVGGPLGQKVKNIKVKDPLELHDIGGDKPLPYNELAKVVIKAIIKHISVVETLGGITKNILKTPGEILDKITPGSKSLPKDLPEKTDDFFKGVFGGDKE